MTNELLELNRIRLDEDLTYEDLAERIGIDRTTLLRLLQQPNRGAHDRTLHKIRRYLDQREAAAPAPRRKAAAR
jgi:transcriptional regulator with XRE-family HTH domain